MNKCKDGVQCTEEEHRRNRRTEFRIVKTNFVPAAGSPEFVAPVIKTVDEDEEIQTDVEEQQRQNIQLEKPKEVTPEPKSVNPEPKGTTPTTKPAPTGKPTEPAKPKK
jgi:hypothetical protein